MSKGSVANKEVTLGEAVELPDASWQRAFRRRLSAWYDRNARDLPWRRSTDPYRVWLSEVMLQQTQVATVESYFQRFTATFPSIEALATADEQKVLRLWEGLGYYRRARQLHRAARLIVQQYAGRFPDQYDLVRGLPGIGRYTAGAILSIAFDQRLPILEANTQRLHCRLLGYRGDPASAAGQRLLWAMAKAILPRVRVGRMNQALMELGGTVCTIRQPACDACPAGPACRARQLGWQEEIPRPKPKRTFESINEVAVLVRRRGRVLLVQQPEGQRWAGLWDFPRFAVKTASRAARKREITRNVRRLTGVSIRTGSHLRTIKHGVTRFRITLDCYEAEYVAAENGNGAAAEMKWLRPAELADYPLCSTGRKLVRLV